MSMGMKIQEVAESFLSRVSLRLIKEEERERFDQLLETEHYLQSARIGGRHLRYIAEVDGDWVAILTFSGAAPHLKPREKWVGWSPRQRARRLGFVINNSRFLLLVERERHPNLASKILGLALRRVAQDWQERWEQRPLVVESFVDESRFRGTCYRACGFEQVGASAGFSRDSRDYYTEHGQPKALYLRELEPGARKTLCRPRLPTALQEHEANIAGPCPLKAGELGSLYERFRALEDPRRGHGLHHRAASTLACAAVATLLGAGSYQGFEDVCKRLTEPQLRALRCHYDRKTKRHTVPGPYGSHYRPMAPRAGHRPTPATCRRRQGPARHGTRGRQAPRPAFRRHPPSARHPALRAHRGKKQRNPRHQTPARRPVD